MGLRALHVHFTLDAAFDGRPAIARTLHDGFLPRLHRARLRRALRPPGPGDPVRVCIPAGDYDVAVYTGPRDGTYFFVDEFGDPVFYDRKGRLIVGAEGCSLILGLGFVELADAAEARRAILALQHDVVNDRYLNRIPSVVKHTSIAFHASKDVPEVRYLMYRLIAGLNFKAQFVVSCKSETIFRDLHNSDENL
jgi:hypothetical protein